MHKNFIRTTVRIAIPSFLSLTMIFQPSRCYAPIDEATGIYVLRRLHGEDNNERIARTINECKAKAGTDRHAGGLGQRIGQHDREHMKVHRDIIKFHTLDDESETIVSRIKHYTDYVYPKYYNHSWCADCRLLAETHLRRALPVLNQRELPEFDPDREIVPYEERQARRRLIGELKGLAAAAAVGVAIGFMADENAD